MKEFLDFLVLILIYFLVFYKKWKVRGKSVIFINTIMYIYISFVLYFTLMPILTSLLFIFNHPYKFMNLEPFVDVINGNGDFVRQILLNVIMMIPFGFLLPLVSQRNIKLKNVIFYTFLFSLCIELLQPLINGIRSSDVTDIITNVAGGIIGYLIYLVFKPLVNKILSLIDK